MKKIGAITIGQAPRTDVMEDLDDILRGDVELIQAGALDLLTQCTGLYQFNISP